MKRSRGLFIATVVVGAISFLALALERLALTDIFHGEPDTTLEWTVVHAGFLPLTLFHVLGVASALVGLRSTRGR